MDIQHFYIEKGQGFPLILLHGNGEESGYFEAQIEAFSKDYRVIAVDTRGHGKTPRGTAPFTIRQFALDLKGFMERLEIEKADLLGFSDGGNIAMVFAMMYPGCVRNLILDGANMDTTGVSEAIQQGIEADYKDAKRRARRSRKAKLEAELLALMIDDPNVKPKELEAITARTLVMAGTEDLILPEHTQLIAESIKGAKLAFVEGDHWIARKNPDAFNRVVADFLKG